MKRITVIVRNQPGVVADLTQVLADRDINIETLDADRVAERGVINLTVDRYDEALHALRDNSFQAVSEDAIVVRVKDEPGALAKVALRFKEAEIGIRSMHILSREEEFSLVSIVCDNNPKALELLKDKVVSSLS